MSLALLGGEPVETPVSAASRWKSNPAAFTNGSLDFSLLFEVVFAVALGVPLMLYQSVLQMTFPVPPFTKTLHVPESTLTIVLL
jgi:hypothetical protein